MNSITKRIQERMKKYQKTDYRIGKVSGKSPQSITKTFRSKKAFEQAIVLDHIAEELHCSANYLKYGKEIPADAQLTKLKQELHQLTVQNSILTQQNNKLRTALGLIQEVTASRKIKHDHEPTSKK